MCGFVGIISKKEKPFSRNTLESMISMIAHRGPDDEGIFTQEPWLSMGFRRLSILDLSAKGHQPMLSHDGRYAIIYNGEVYNYREIREELKGRGVRFTSGTDTEVVLSAYLEYGETCVNKFTGMFAFLIADLREKTIFAARDQLGIKPLFLFEDNDYFIFCSEIKSLLPYTSLSPNKESINEYLVFRSIVGRPTMFNEVVNILPGEFAKLKHGVISYNRYFNLNSTLSHDFKGTFQDACDMTESTLTGSIDLHLRSDVELGVQLSGGVDSSLITALSAQKNSKKLHTFSISFPDAPECDESIFQKRIADRYGTEHHDYQIGDSDFTAQLERSIWHYEHPLNDPNTVCSYILCEKARKFVTVMMSGEGADESFMGYAKFTQTSVNSVSQRTFLHKHRHLSNILFGITGKPLFKITKYEPAMFALCYDDLNIVDQLLNDDYSSMRERIAVSGRSNSIIDKIIMQDESCDLQQWLWRADRQGMAASMELRVPFCTSEMFSLGNSMPYSYHIRNGIRKAILKKVAEHYMDNDQIYRKKMGFEVPISLWLESKKGDYSDLFNSIIHSERTRQRSIINQGHLKSLLKAYSLGEYQERQCGFLWTYLNFELWYRIFFENGWKSL